MDTIRNRARALRKNQTIFEQSLWQALRAKRLGGYKFYRQYIMDGYIADFCCPSKRLVIELDGGGHNEIEQIKYDQRRDDVFVQHGFRLIRIWNNEWDQNRSGVLEKVLELLNM